VTEKIFENFCAPGMGTVFERKKNGKILPSWRKRRKINKTPELGRQNPNLDASGQVRPGDIASVWIAQTLIRAVYRPFVPTRNSDVPIGTGTKGPELGPKTESLGI
jgi:hypothetical protein